MSKSDENPPPGAMIFYSLPKETKEEVRLQISDAKGNVIQEFSSDHMPVPNPEFPYDFMGKYDGDRKLTKNIGLNRFVWDLRYPVVDFPEHTIVWGFLGGPVAPPGSYKASLLIGSWKQEQSFQILKDPRASASQADLEEQFALQLHIKDRLNELYAAVKNLRSVKQQSEETIDHLATKGKDVAALKKMSADLQSKMRSVEDELIQWRNEADQDTENYPTKLDNQLAYVYGQLDLTDSRPTEGQKQRVRDLEKDIDTQLTRLKSIVSVDVVAFNKAATDLGAHPVL